MGSVRVAGLTKRFGDVTAVDDLTLAIPEGAFASLLGPSGCGKTTTMRMIAGLERPSEGEIRIGARSVSAPGVHVPPEGRAIGMVFQSYAVWPHMTVAENVAFPLRVRRLPRAEIETRTAKALDIVRLAPLAARYPSQISGGQQQRVALARAIVFDPDLLLLDEPLSNLDAKLREEMRFEIRRLQRRLGITALFVTHDQEEAFALSDSVAVMERGRLVQIGAPQAIFDEPRTRFVAEFVGWKNLVPATVLDPASSSPRIAAIRPEALRLDGAGEVTCQGIVASSLFHGTFSAIEVAVGEHVLVVHDPRRRMPAPGETVTLAFDRASLRLLEG